MFPWNFGFYQPGLLFNQLFLVRDQRTGYCGGLCVGGGKFCTPLWRGTFTVYQGTHTYGVGSSVQGSLTGD